MLGLFQYCSTTTWSTNLCVWFLLLCSVRKLLRRQGIYTHNEHKLMTHVTRKFFAYVVVFWVWWVLEVNSMIWGLVFQIFCHASGSVCYVASALDAPFWPPALALFRSCFWYFPCTVVCLLVAAIVVLQGLSQNSYSHFGGWLWLCCGSAWTYLYMYTQCMYILDTWFFPLCLLLCSVAGYQALPRGYTCKSGEWMKASRSFYGCLQ